LIDGFFLLRLLQQFRDPLSGGSWGESFMVTHIFGLLWLALQGPVTRHIRQVFYLLIFSSIFQIFDQ